MSLQKLKRLAMYVLQAALWIGAIYLGMAVLGGILYLDEASKIDYADMRQEIFSILKKESIIVGVATVFLFWIGSIRTYLARNSKAEQRKQRISQPRLKAFEQTAHTLNRNDSDLKAPV